MGTSGRQDWPDFRAVDKAFAEGDMTALLQALGEPGDFPRAPVALGPGLGENPLEYAIYWSPVAFVAELLERGADPSRPDPAGFPPVIAALSSERPERLKIIALLLEHGADVAQRGINDWTPLHYAVAQGDLAGAALLLEHGADPGLRTRIDHCTSALEDAEAAGFEEAAALLRGALSR
ncbi:ankyrin repeat domain-containing protein [Oceanibacterium hippocampi]|uniref:Ankyrin repeats (3 copies) n=1 Tax=Oceanibacterium hippocampi TaxID=745714 RepID=A0A1Y5SEY4_9PROT|nr:ankyrin repeat domain-containing protein [Oceanibacterium hippocampi]SLN39228.1 Ankyrin repeats (3 copies) [Oceanibacterium hippocampi]